MASVISKTSNNSGVYRYIENIVAASFNPAEWEINPDISNVVNVAKNHWKYNGTNVVIEMSEAEKNIVDLSITVNTNEIGSIEFSKRGLCKNTWLRAGGGILQPSNKQPLILFNDGVITGLTFSNLKNNIDVDILIYKNGILVYTWEIRDMRYAFKTSGLAGIQFTTGDQISIYTKQVGNKLPSWVMVNIQYRYMLQTLGDGGSSTL